MSMDTKSYRTTVLNVLIAAIRNGNSAAIVSVRAKAIAVIGYEDYARIYKQAFNLVNTRDYKFVDFSPKVISRSDDSSTIASEAIKPHHNID